MARLLEVTLSDTVGAGTAWQAGSEGYIVGSPPVWKDDSDATYASYAGQYFGPGNPQYSGSATSAVVSVPALTLVGLEKIVVRFRMAQVGGSPAKMPWIRLEASNVNGFKYVPTGPAPSSPTWVELTLAGYTPGQLNDFIARPTTYTLNFMAPVYDAAVETVPNEIQRFNIYEAHVFISLPSNEAPPCRMFPRDDDLGVGAGRNFPPAKSQQRSSRGVGYY